MKRSKPCAHTRVIKTKNGRKKVLVNKGVKKKQPKMKRAMAVFDDKKEANWIQYKRDNNLRRAMNAATESEDIKEWHEAVLYNEGYEAALDDLNLLNYKDEDELEFNDKLRLKRR